MELDIKNLTEAQKRDLAKLQERQHEIKQWQVILDNATKKMNIMTEQEFERYAPLYRKHDLNPTKEEDQPLIEELKALSDEFYRRINPYAELTITTNDGSEVLAVLPKMFTTLNVIKPGYEKNLTDFEVKTSIPFRKDIQAEGVNKLVEAIAVSQDVTFNKELKEQEQQRYIELEEKIRIKPESQDVKDKINNELNITQPSNNTEQINSVITWDFEDE